MYKKLVLAIFVLAISISAYGQKSEMKTKKIDDKKAVVAVVDKLFDNMAAHKPDAIVALHTADAQLVALIKQADGKSLIQTLKAEQFSKSFAVKNAEIKEVMYDHKVEIHDDLALVSGRYVFFVNDKISHCGANAFHLVRTEKGWLIGGASSTMDRNGCTDKEKAMKAK